MTIRIPTTQQAGAAALALLTLVTGMLTAVDFHTPLRLYLTVAFVLLAPGWALAAYLRTDRPALIWSVAVSLGIAVTILVAQTMVSSGFWHPEGALLVLAGLTFTALLHHMVRRVYGSTHDGLLATVVGRTLALIPNTSSPEPRFGWICESPSRRLTREPRRSAFWRQAFHRSITPMLAILSVALWLLGLHPITPNQMDSVGLIKQLSPVLLLSYPVLIAAVLLELAAARPRQRLLAACTSLGVLLVYGLQPASEQIARLSTAWAHVGYADYIAQHGQVLNGYDARFSWPGFFSLAGFVSRASGQADMTQLLQWAPLALAGLSTLGIRALAAVTGHCRLAWVATWLFLLTQWTEQDYFSPQAASYVLMLGALTLTVRYLVRPGLVDPLRANMRSRLVPLGTPLDRLTAQAAILLIGLALAPTHQLTPFMLGALLLVMLLTGRLWSAWLPWAVLLPAVAWFCLGAKDLWQGHLNLIVGDIGHVSSTVGQVLSERFVGDTGRTFILDVRVGLTFVMGLLAAAGWWCLRRHAIRSWTLPLLAAAPFGLIVLNSYGGEVLLRCYLFALPFASILAGLAVYALIATPWHPRLPYTAANTQRPANSGLRRAATLSVAVLLLTALGLATVTARGGNDAYTSFSRTDLAAVEYVYQHAQVGQTIGVLTDDLPFGYKRLGAVRELNLESCPNLERIDACVLAREINFLIVTPPQENDLQIESGLPAAAWTSQLVCKLVASGKYQLVYARGGSRVLAETNGAPIAGSPP